MVDFGKSLDLFLDDFVGALNKIFYSMKKLTEYKSIQTLKEDTESLKIANFLKCSSLPDQLRKKRNKIPKFFLSLFNGYFFAGLVGALIVLLIQLLARFMGW